MARTHKSISIRCGKIQALGNDLMVEDYEVPGKGLSFVEVCDRDWRKLFDGALDLTHYSYSCQRVGRCMRLAIVEDGEWVGGIVLGSTFPNILVRDESVGLRKFVTNYKQRGLTNPWSRKNRQYWGNLQKVVNHARTFVFPQAQGRGIGIRAHRLLLTQGVAMWENKYQDQVYALDTLCTADESKLFLLNGWTRAGQTKGYTLDRTEVFSKSLKVVDDREKGIKNNGALRKGENSVQWWVWTIQLHAF
jgi:GNAT superfamily N-acetyltransferase